MSRRSTMPASRLVVVLALCALAGILALSAVAQPSHAWRTIPLNGTFKVDWTGPLKACPPGVPKVTAKGSVTPCFLNVGHANMAGLGAVTERYIMAVLGSDTKCQKLKFTAVLTVAGKGTITAPAATKNCIVSPVNSIALDESTAQFHITGGTHAYAGATGHGTIHQVNHAATGGTVTDTWNGTLTLKG